MPASIRRSVRRKRTGRCHRTRGASRTDGFRLGLVDASIVAHRRTARRHDDGHARPPRLPCRPACPLRRVRPRVGPGVLTSRPSSAPPGKLAGASERAITSRHQAAPSAPPEQGLALRSQGHQPPSHGRGEHPALVELITNVAAPVAHHRASPPDSRIRVIPDIVALADTSGYPRIRVEAEFKSRRTATGRTGVGDHADFYRLFYRTVRHAGLLHGTRHHRHAAFALLSGSFWYGESRCNMATRPLRIRRLRVRIPPSARDKCRSEAVFCRAASLRTSPRENILRTNSVLTVLGRVLMGVLPCRRSQRASTPTDAAAGTSRRTSARTR